MLLARGAEVNFPDLRKHLLLGAEAGIHCELGGLDRMMSESRGARTLLILVLKPESATGTVLLLTPKFKAVSPER